MWQRRTLTAQWRALRQIVGQTLLASVVKLCSPDQRQSRARPYASNRARAIAFGHFNRKYNFRRRHGELGGLTPMQRLIADVNNVRGQLS